MASEIRIGNETTGLHLYETPVLDTGTLPVLVYDSSNGDVKYRTITGGGSAVWGSITGDISNQTDLVSYVSGKESSLGVPSVDGYVLSSTTAGVRSWISNGGYTFSNGITETGGSVKLGGIFTQATGLELANNNFTLFSSSSTYHSYMDINLNDAYDIAMFNVYSQGSSNHNYWSISGSNPNIHLDHFVDASNGSSFKVADTYISNSVKISGLTYGVTLSSYGFSYSADYSANYTDRSLVDKAYVTNNTAPIPVDDILDWSTNKYTPYTVSTAGCFDNSSTVPTSTSSRLNYNGIFYTSLLKSGNSTTTDSYNIQAIDGSKGSIFRVNGDDVSLRIEQGGSVSSSSSLLQITRDTSGSANTTGNIITIVDNPSTSGTISGSVLKATIGTTVRMDFNPRVVDSGTAIGYTFDTHNVLSNSNAKIVSFCNHGTEIAFIGTGNTQHGIFATTTTYSALYGQASTSGDGVSGTSASGRGIYGFSSSNNGVMAVSTTGIALKVNNLSGNTSKLATFLVDVTEKTYIDYTGNIFSSYLKTATPSATGNWIGIDTSTGLFKTMTAPQTTTLTQNKVWVGNASNIATETDTVSIPYGTNISSYATGTVYSLTATYALLDFGTTDPSITISAAGTWKITSGIYVKYNAATFAANQTLSIKVYRTNNTAADVIVAPDTTLEILTTTTKGFGNINLPPIIYSTVNTNDILQLWGKLSVVPSAGTVDIVGAWIMAEQIY